MSSSLQKAVPAEVYLWCKVKHAVRWGKPYREILSYAKEHEIDLISMGAHGSASGCRRFSARTWTTSFASRHDPRSSRAREGELRETNSNSQKEDEPLTWRVDQR